MRSGRGWRFAGVWPVASLLGTACQGVVTCRVEAGALLEQPLAGDGIDLEPDAVGIEERERVVAGRPRSLLGGADHSRAEILQEAVEGVDLLAAARAKAAMVQAGAQRVVRLVRVARVGPRDRDRGAAAQVVDEVVLAMDDLQAEPGHQLVIEGDALPKATHAQLNVGDSVDLHAPIAPTPR